MVNGVFEFHCEPTGGRVPAKDEKRRVRRGYPGGQERMPPKALGATEEVSPATSDVAPMRGRRLAKTMFIGENTS